MQKKDVLNRDPFIENVMGVIETISSRLQGCCFCIKRYAGLCNGKA